MSMDQSLWLVQPAEVEFAVPALATLDYVKDIEVKTSVHSKDNLTLVKPAGAMYPKPATGINFTSCISEGYAAASAASTVNATVSVMNNTNAFDFIANALHCEYCNRVMNSRSQLSVHRLRFHKVRAQTKLNHLCKEQATSGNEAFCHEAFSSLRGLKDHLTDKHGLEFVERTYDFSNEEAFQNFKEELERKEGVSFVKHSGAKRRATKQVCYYYCHRSGLFLSTGTGKRKLKKSCKTPLEPSYKPDIDNYCKNQQTCPANMKVVTDIDSGKVVVTVCNTHAGHDFRPRHSQAGRSQIRLPVPQDFVDVPMIRDLVTTHSLDADIHKLMSTILLRLQYATDEKKEETLRILQTACDLLEAKSHPTCPVAKTVTPKKSIPLQASFRSMTKKRPSHTRFPRSTVNISPLQDHDYTPLHTT